MSISTPCTLILLQQLDTQILTFHRPFVNKFMEDALGYTMHSYGNVLPYVERQL